jgi:hypothetical protein
MKILMAIGFTQIVLQFGQADPAGLPFARRASSRDLPGVHRS